jgi:hypothetical protein
MHFMYVIHATFIRMLCFTYVNKRAFYPCLQTYRVFNNCHIFCCNMFVFACPIIAKCQCWLFALSGQISVFALFALKYPYLPYLPSNIRICPICPQISVFALIYPYFPPYSTSGICTVVSKTICQSTRKDHA